MQDDGAPQVPGPEENGLPVLAEAQNFADFFVKVLDIVAVALLAEAAEAVEVLADLGSREPHFCGKVARRDADGPRIQQIL